MEPIVKYLISTLDGTPKYVAKAYQDTDYEPFSDETYGVGVITDAYTARRSNTYMKQEAYNSTVYTRDMPKKCDLDDGTVCEVINQCVRGLYFVDRGDVAQEWREQDVSPGTESYYDWINRQNIAVDAIMEKHAEEFIKEHGIVWDSYEGYDSDSATWLVFSTAKMREAAGIEHTSAKEYVASRIKEIRQINEGEVYGYEVCDLVPIEVQEGFEDIAEDSDLCILRDGVWYKMTNEQSCWGFVGYDSHETTIRESGLIDEGEYKFSTL